MQNRVLVLDKNQQPLMPCHPARARELLSEGKAAVFRRYPFTIILKYREGGDVQNARLKLDPGSKTTGIALVASFFRRGLTLIWAAELEHRGAAIRKALQQRAAHRRFRRSRLRYRAPRFLNRTRKKGRLAPSLQHRVDTVTTWVFRMMRFSPVSALSQELVKFDMQVMQGSGISRIAYQQGTLFGYDIREYLLEKWRHQCAYCDAKQVPLTIDHIHPRSKGGSDRVSNLTIACSPCNQRKNNLNVADFLAHDPKRLARIEAVRKMPLRDAAAVNSTRWALYMVLQQTGLPVEVGSGGRTKWNRSQQQYPKAHWLDAACVGVSGASVRLSHNHRPLLISAKGHGERQRARLNRNGFPVGHKAVTKCSYGFQTGDIVKAVVASGKFVGTHVGRVAVRARPSFALFTADLGKSFDVHPKYLTILQSSDGYAYD